VLLESSAVVLVTDAECSTSITGGSTQINFDKGVINFDKGVMIEAITEKVAVRADAYGKLTLVAVG
jgi:hypothetical protein